MEKLPGYRQWPVLVNPVYPFFDINYYCDAAGPTACGE
jgi:hypothetical protein